MEFLVEKIGMSRSIGSKSYAVTLLRVLNAKICEIYQDQRALVAYTRGKSTNKIVQGQQKKYNLSKEFNRFATLTIGGESKNSGDLDFAALDSVKRLKVSFRTKGRGFSGVMKRWNFQGGPASHGSRFHRRPGSIGNREWPGRVQPGKKMAGHYGNEMVSVQSEVLSFDKESRVLVLRGSVPGFSGAYGKVKVLV